MTEALLGLVFGVFTALIGVALALGLALFRCQSEFAPGWRCQRWPFHFGPCRILERDAWGVVRGIRWRRR